MKRVYLVSLILVVAIIGIAAFVAVSSLLQPKPRPVSVTFAVISRNGAGGCFNEAGLPLTILNLDGRPLTLNSTSVLDTGANSTTVTLMSGSTHTISANQTYTGKSNYGQSCPEQGGLNATANFGGWEEGYQFGVISTSNTLRFVVPSNGSEILVASYWVD